MTKNGGARQSALFDDEIDEEGSAFHTATDTVVEFATRGKSSMPAAHGGNNMPKIPDATDEIMQSPHPPARKEATSRRLQPHCC
jgi:hypothetical protein